MLFYPAALPLSSRTLSYDAGVIRRHRGKIGSCWRKLSPARQALLLLAYLRKGETFAGLKTSDTPDQVTIEDLGSKNGTMLRRQPIDGPTPIVDRDELQIGSVEMIVRILRGREATETL